MTDTVSALGGVLIAITVSMILAALGFRGARLVSLVGTVLLYLAAVTMTEKIVGLLMPLVQGETISGAVRTVLKIVGVSYVASLASDVCRGMGELGAADAILIVGRVEILLLATPSVVGIVLLASELIGG